MRIFVSWKRVMTSEEFMKYYKHLLYLIIFRKGGEIWCNKIKNFSINLNLLLNIPIYNHHYQRPLIFEPLYPKNSWKYWENWFRLTTRTRFAHVIGLWQNVSTNWKLHSLIIACMCILVGLLIISDTGRLRNLCYSPGRHFMRHNDRRVFGTPPPVGMTNNAGKLGRKEAVFNSFRRKLIPANCGACGRGAV